MKSPRVMVVGPQPPPVHGAALVTDWVRRDLEAAGAHVLVVDTSGSDGGGALRRVNDRLRRHLRAMLCLVRHRRAFSSLYVGGAGGMGVWHQALLVATARLVGVPVFFHHHSFAYLNQRRASMWCLTAAGGSAVEHLALSPRMAVLLGQRYPRARRISVCSNAGLLSPSPSDVRVPHERGPVVLGHLSNLSVEKGLMTVLDAARQVVAAGHDVRLLLGGPATTREAQQLIEQAQVDLPGAFTYLGAVPRDAVDDFYAQLDLFLFPSTYVHEAEPLVVIEAARAGVPTIAFDVGSLQDMLGEPRWLVDPADDYSSRVVEIVAAMTQPGERATARDRAALHFEERRRAASAAHRDLVKRIISSDSGSARASKREESGTSWH